MYVMLCLLCCYVMLCCVMMWCWCRHVVMSCHVMIAHDGDRSDWTWVSNPTAIHCWDGRVDHCDLNCHYLWSNIPIISYIMHVCVVFSRVHVMFGCEVMVNVWNLWNHLVCHYLYWVAVDIIYGMYHDVGHMKQVYYWIIKLIIVSDQCMFCHARIMRCAINVCFVILILIWCLVITCLQQPGSVSCRVHVVW